MENGVYINNKLKKIYQETSNYQDLKEAERDFFDQIFNVLWISGEMNLTNKYIAERFGYSPSTIEKKLRRIERANLIYRQISRFKDENDRWQTLRIITLDPVLKNFLLEKLKFKPAGVLAAVEEAVKKDEIKEPVLKKDVVTEKNNNKFNFNKLRR